MPSVDHGLEEVARLVFIVQTMNDDDLYHIVAVGQSLACGDDGSASSNLGFFLIAWAAERIARHRIASGDLGIDDAERRITECRGNSTWQQAIAEYQALADEIHIDTLNELREFSMVVLYMGRREIYQRRFAAGQRLLADYLPSPTHSDMCLALAG